MNYKKLRIDDVDVFYLHKNNKFDSKEFLSLVLNNEYGILYYEIIKNENGKPYLKDNKVYFNISHKKDIIGIAVSKNEIGFDIEYIDVEKEIKDSVLNNCFSELERNYIDCDIERFFEIFTKKESYIKLLGGRVAEIKYVDVFDLNCKFYKRNIDNYIFMIAKK